MSDENPYVSIKNWAEDDRPREKLLLKGKHALSNAELLAILISTGTKEASAVELGKRILKLAGDNLNELGRLGVKDLTKVKGIGKAKAITIAAALELGARRRVEEVMEKAIIRSSRNAFDIMHPLLADLKKEEFWILLLNRANKVIHKFRVSEGGVAGTVADPKIIFKTALDHLASGVILCHNHPSGNNKPSQSDIDLTKKMKEAGKLLEIAVLDHIIIAENNYYSFADEGIM
ncbi:MAG: DNA repair protein RadC [Bacteroidia bacterium]|nr:DNA repair protein RadC [Bacteroidia bacterium]